VQSMKKTVDEKKRKLFIKGIDRNTTNGKPRLFKIR